MCDGGKAKARIALHPYVTRYDGVAGDGHVVFKVRIMADMCMGLYVAPFADVRDTYA